MKWTWKNITSLGVVAGFVISVITLNQVSNQFELGTRPYISLATEEGVSDYANVEKNEIEVTIPITNAGSRPASYEVSPKEMGGITITPYQSTNGVLLPGDMMMLRYKVSVGPNTMPFCLAMNNLRFTVDYGYKENDHSYKTIIGALLLEVPDENSGNNNWHCGDDEGSVMKLFWSSIIEE